MSAERMVKGSVMLDMVKIIRALKDLPWDKYLTEEDMDIINSMLIPTQWYPIESYQRMGLAVYELAAGGSDDAVVQFGRQAVNEFLEGPYSGFLKRGDPFGALNKFLELRRSLFNFSTMGMEKTGEKSARIKISDFGDMDTGLDLFALLLEVHLAVLVEVNGGNDVKCDTKSRLAGGGELVFDLTWA